MKKKKIDVCGLSETKLVSSKLQLMHKLRLKQWRVFSNVEATSVARIVVLWNPSTVNVDSIDSSPQALHLIIRNLETQFTCAANFVYVYNSVSGPFEIILGGGLLHALGLYLVFLSSLLPV